jgi:hypothetical protein
MLKCLVYCWVTCRALGGINIIARYHLFAVLAVIVPSEEKESAGQQQRYDYEYGTKPHQF